MQNLSLNIWDMVFVSLIGGLIALDRVSMLQIMVSRPIVAAPVIGLLLGDVLTGLKAGFLLELLWIGCLPVGAFVPPDETIVSLVVTSATIICSRLLAGSRDELMILSLCLTIPASIFAMRVDSYVRKRNIRSAHAADDCAEAGDFKGLQRVCLKGLQRFYLGYLLMIFFFLLANVLLLPLIFPLLPSFVREGLGLTCHILPLIGLASLLAMMRVKNTFPLFGASFVGAFCFFRVFYA